MIGKATLVAKAIQHRLRLFLVVCWRRRVVSAARLHLRSLSIYSHFQLVILPIRLHIVEREFEHIDGLGPSAKLVSPASRLLL